MVKNVSFLIMVPILFFCCCENDEQADSTAGGKKMKIKVSSSAF